MQKQYVFKVTERIAHDGTTFPDYTSHTYKSKRKAESAMYDFDALPNVTCGGSASQYLYRIR